MNSDEDNLILNEIPLNQTNEKILVTAHRVQRESSQSAKSKAAKWLRNRWENTFLARRFYCKSPAQRHAKSQDSLARNCWKLVKTS